MEFGSSPKDSLHDMLALFDPGDARGSTNFATLEALEDALKKAGLGTFADNLHLFLSL